MQSEILIKRKASELCHLEDTKDPSSHFSIFDISDEIKHGYF